MKNLLLTSVATLMIVAAMAQCPTTDGFESWTVTKDTSMMGTPFTLTYPDNWTSITDAMTMAFVGGTSSIVKSTDKNAGSFAVEIDVNNTSKKTGVDLMSIDACAQKPSRMTGYYKWDGGTKDTLDITIASGKGSQADDKQNIAASGTLQIIGAKTSYTKFTINLTAQQPVTPDTLVIMFVAINGTTATTRHLKLDDLAFEYGTLDVPSAEMDKPAIEIYPNPVKDYATIHSTFTNEATISLYDLTGKKILSEIIGTADHTINMKDMQQGIYLLQIESGNEKYTRKIVKM